ncbi:hypothetical protein GY45DRAFT_1370133 [Cubamyces sp. BRFM 1775]|nr:hypothetical protein GY45DRAFT_1370133 [Cubamyces sp. BRFM 1775]
MSLCVNTVSVDDFDPNIVYSGPWQAFHDQAYGVNGTRHVATRTGLSANFKFNGSCLVVNGIVGADETVPMPPTTFILDGHFTQINHSATIGEPFALVPQYASAILYIAMTISEGPHKLIITNLDGDSKTPLVLDEFRYTPLNPQPLSSNTSASSSASSASSASSTMTATSTSHPAPTGPSSSATSHSTSSVPSSRSSSYSTRHAIIGGVVGAICLLLLAVLGYVVRRRSSRRRKNAEDAVSDIRAFASWRGDDLRVQTQTQVQAPGASRVIALGGNTSPPGSAPAAASPRGKQLLTLQSNMSALFAPGPAHGGAQPPESGLNSLQRALPPAGYEHGQTAGGPPGLPGPQQDRWRPSEDLDDSETQPPEYSP